MSLEDAAVEDVAIENVDVQNAAVQNAPVQNVPVQNAAVEGRAGPPDVESGNEVAQVETQECVACGDAKSFTDIVGLPCNHNFCVRCVVDFFTASLRDDSLFPPRCCQIPIPLQSVAGFLALDTLAIFQQKAFEMEVANRTYCSSPACASFILPSRIVDNKATCEMCNTATCTLCKGDFHTGECPEDPGMKSLESTAAANGWKRCSSCRTFIELEGGCYHITCRCGAQFCYLCGLVWKTCDCRLWNEENLVHNAELNLGHGAEPNVVDQLPPLVQFDLVHNVLYRPGGAAAQNFQPNPQRPQCQHRNWRRVDGPHVCRGGCQFRLPNYIFACRNCGHLACRRCRRPNRRQQ